MVEESYPPCDICGRTDEDTTYPLNDHGSETACFACAEASSSAPPLLVTYLERCARCGGDHTGLKFWSLERPMVSKSGDRYEFWAMCPTTDEPILMMVSDS